MIVFVTIFLALCFMRVLGEAFYERKFPVRTLPLLIVFTVFALYALVNL
jgi:hypothetical protein